MPDVVAKTMAFISALLLAGAVAVLYVTSRPAAGANEVVAEFQDAFPLLEGMYVRVDGAVAGSVGDIEVSDDGLARVTLILDEAIEDPSSDATAGIRQQDTTGDSYVAFEPGTSGRPLGKVDGVPTIQCNPQGRNGPCTSTLVAPRFDDLLNAFGPEERAGVKLILGELSRSLDDRGDDVNAAALELRPALVSANEALREVQSQNAALRAVIDDAENVTGQAAARRAELAGLIDGLATTTQALASESTGLDRGLERLPATLSQTRSTMASLGRAAEAGIPLAQELQASAPGLARAIEATPGFLEDADVVLGRAAPTLELTRRLLVAGDPTIRADPKRVVTGPFDLAPALSNLLTGVLGDDNTIKALFGDDSGGLGPGTLDRSGLAAVAVEPGDQPGYPPSNENRNMLRISALLNCEMFGVPIEPGCLASVIGPRRSGAGTKGGSAERQRTDAGPGGPSPDLPDEIREVGEDAGDIVREVEDLVDEAGGGRGLPDVGGSDIGSDETRPDGRAMKDVLDFLLR